MKRIDPSAVPEMFRRRRLKPVVSDWVGDVLAGECCILSALYCDARGCDDAPACLREIESADDRLGVAAAGIGLDDRDYAVGVMNGWDEPDLGGLDEDEHESMTPKRLGYRDGALARLNVASSGMEIVNMMDIDEEDDDRDDGEDDLDDDQEYGDWYDEPDDDDDLEDES